jgi:hypothetical protein
MLERDEMVYDLGHPALRELRGKHPWIPRRPRRTSPKPERKHSKWRTVTG